MDQPPIYHKRIRMRGNDYRQGAYFVTLCTAQRQDLFGRIVGGGTDAMMAWNDVGRIVDECWRAIPDHFPFARLDQTQIMPDHLHAILVLNPPVDLAPIVSTQGADATGAPRTVGARSRGPAPGSLSAIIAAFKSLTTRRISAVLGRTGGTIWQHGYHERIIRRHGGKYGRIAQYISDNPARWR